MSWVDLFPIVARIDALQARVDKLESFQLVTMPADIPAPDSVDTVITTIVIPANSEAQGSAHLSFELTDTSGSPRLVTAWIESLGNITITGPSAGQITLHPQLPTTRSSIGPVRAVVGDSAANLVLKVRSDLRRRPGAGGVVVKAATSIVPGGGGAKPRASGLIAPVRHEPDWRGIAAVLIVVGVFTVLIIGALNGGHNPNYVLSDEALATVSTLLGAAVGAVAVYLGGRRRGPPRDPPSSGKDLEAPP